MRVENIREFLDKDVTQQKMILPAFIYDIRMLHTSVHFVLKKISSRYGKIK